ncbi:Fic/DOC family protein [Pontibacterium sp.]|uniref:Fic/DOC family protein n=1 Tax=Pontibacterium sp. TaxID=2036026 RepID=UPI003513E228
MSRYDVTSSEGEYQPGGEEGVLRNRLGLTLKQDIDDAETELLDALYLVVLEQSWATLSMSDIQRWHRQWLGNLYDWAGETRTVNMSKGDFHFAAAGQLPALIKQFDKQYLSRFEQLPDLADDEVVNLLAESHVEFILIHPFREGNGRISRLLLNVMALKAGFQPLDYQLWEENKAYYFKAIQAGVGGDYQHVARLVRDVLEQQAGED